MIMIDELLSCKDKTSLRDSLSLQGLVFEDILQDPVLSFSQKNSLLSIDNNERDLCFGKKVKFFVDDKLVNGFFIGFYLYGRRLEADNRAVYVPEIDKALMISVADIMADTKKSSKLSNTLREKLLGLLELPEVIEPVVDQSEDRPTPVFSREDTRTPYTELIDSSLPLAKQIEGLAKQLSRLEDEEVALPVFVAFAMLPSAICSIAPIGVIHGLSGSGKSALGSLISGMYDIPVMASNGTYAGIRNHIADYKFMSEGGGERNRHIVIDDTSPETFKDEKLFVLLKVGTSVNGGGTCLSTAETGSNKNFDPYAPKTISTISDFWRLPEYKELVRRILIFETIKEDLEDTDREYIDKEEISYKPSSEDGLHERLHNFWVSNQTYFKEVRRKVRKKEADRELVSVLAVIYDVSIEQATEMLTAYRGAVKSSVFAPDTRTEYLEQFLIPYYDQATANRDRLLLYKKMGKIKELPSIFIKVKASELASQFKQGSQLGIFDSGLATASAIAELMKARKFELVSKDDSWYWQKLLDF